jgi:hypothetical protein
MENKYFRIDINTNLPEEILQYIFDCWATFVVGDLGLIPSQLPMLLVEGE